MRQELGILIAALAGATLVYISLEHDRIFALAWYDDRGAADDDEMLQRARALNAADREQRARGGMDSGLAKVFNVPAPLLTSSSMPFWPDHVAVPERALSVRGASRLRGRRRQVRLRALEAAADQQVLRRLFTGRQRRQQASL